MYKFVLIDNDAHAQEWISTALDWDRFRFDEPIFFRSGTEALEYLRLHRVDVVMTDVYLKDSSAAEIIHELRQNNPQTLIIFHTERQSFEDAYNGIKLGIFDYYVKPVSDEQLEELMCRILNRLDNWPMQATTKPAGEGWESIISMARKYIDDNLTNNIRLETLAQYVHMNPTYFSRYFKKHTNQKLIDYITEQRIKRAIELMRDPTVKIYNIGYQVGYKNLQHFYKIFKQNTGFTPNEYRKQFYGMQEALPPET